MTLSSTVGWRLPVAKPVPPSVTPWYIVTFSPTSAVSPITTPIPWSMNSPSPTRAARMDLDPGQRARDVGQRPRRHRDAGAAQRVRDAVGQQRVDAGPGGEDLGGRDALRRRVAVARRRDVAADLSGDAAQGPESEHAL